MRVRTVPRFSIAGLFRHFSFDSYRRTLLKSAANPLPATFFRGGTSKGIFINRNHLPDDPANWARIFLGIMGSPDPVFQRQLNGLGGGISSLSKVCVVGKPCDALAERGIDIAYTFAQVSITDDIVDYSGNCGNLTSVVGAFAVDEGLCSPKSTDGRATVRTFNTNTGKLVDLTFPVATSYGTDASAITSVLDLDEVAIAGVPGMASRIVLDFLAPSGARTGKLLPSHNPTDTIIIPASQGLNNATEVCASLVDAANPTVFISHLDLCHLVSRPDDSPTIFSDVHVLSLLETIRQLAAEGMGLDPSAQAQPKIAVLSAPSEVDRESGVDIRVHALSMGVLHRAVPMTIGLCLGVAANVEGTIAFEIVRRTRAGHATMDTTMVRIAHPSGLVDVDVKIDGSGEVQSAKVVRTARKLMKGVVWW